MDKVSECKKLHYELKGFIDAKNWKMVNKRMKEIRFMHDVNMSKTALIVTQDFVNLPEIKDERYLMYQWFNNDLGHDFRNHGVFKNNDINVPK